MLDRLTLDQLRILATIADTGSFSAAARRLSRVQSAVSQSVQALEDTLRLQLFDRSHKTPRLTEAGRVILADARRLLAGTEALKARAAAIADDVEPELTLAVDPMFPNHVLMASLKALSAEFPLLAVAVYTEGVGGAEQRLRDGAARLAIYAPLITQARGLETAYLTDIALIPVAAAKHPLAQIRRRLTREDLGEHVQLVLTDRTAVTTGFSGGIVSHRIWRFADLAVRLEYLLAGFGWCNMPEHMVAELIKKGRLKPLRMQDRSHDRREVAIHVVHDPSRPPGRAGRWLIADLKNRLAA